MREHFKSALDQIKADRSLVKRTEARLRDRIDPSQYPPAKFMKGRFYEMKRLAVAACLALLLMGGGYAYSKPTAYLNVDINPSVELSINVLDRVVGVQALNEDGQAILEGLDVEGMQVDEAVELIVDAAADQGFIKKNGSSVVSITAATDDQDKADKLTKDAEEGAQEALAENEVAAEVSQAAISHARYAAAKDTDLNISPGKLNLIQRLWEISENDGVAATEDDFDDIVDFANDPFGDSDFTYAEAPVREIMKAIKEARIGNELEASDSDSEEDDVIQSGKGNANAPGQLLKAGNANADSNALILPNGKTKKVHPVDAEEEEEEID